MMPAQDVTGVFDSSFNQYFKDARTMKVSVTRDKQVMKHPVEDGSTISDHVILNPIEIQLIVFTRRGLEKSVYGQIATLFKANTLVTVQTRVDSFKNMLMVGMPHEETTEMTDVVAIVQKFEETRLVKLAYSTAAPKAKKNTDTIKRGEQQPKSSVAYKIFN
jgi:hypothetical protein